MILEVTKREGLSADAVRTAGNIPAVVYGPKQASLSIAVDKIIFEKMLHEAGESTIITLKGAGEDIEVLIHDTVFDAVKGGVIHVDFYAIERGKELTTNVGLEFIGVSPVEKLGMTINKNLHEVEVTCLPRVLPSHIDVDISVLVDEDSQIHVKDLVLPEGVRVEDDVNAVVASVSASREEEPETVSVAPDMSEIEVEKKGKEDNLEEEEK